MLDTTVEVIKAGLRADPTVSAATRKQLLTLLRSGQQATQNNQPSPSEPRLIRRGEVARRLSCSLRTIDKLAASGTLRKRKLPGRSRAAGFLETDVNALLVGSEGAQ